ncbi:GapA-binding peptide SR1P [Caenibacillus caldisaponilyticus]|nr:GapA-binding peptide SR1P [Caenibacillus caldisaponilyticus]
MGIIVCQHCDRIIAHVDDIKVRTLFATCQTCQQNENEKRKHKE